MKLIIVTPTMGRSAWLAETVAAVAAAAPEGRHVLVAPAAEVARLAQLYPKTQVVAETGAGMYTAINAGLAAVKDWDAFTYINDDDLLLPDYAAVQEVVARTGGACVGYGGVRLIDAEGRRLGGIPVSSAPALNRALYAERLEPVYQHGMTATRAVVEAIGVFDGSLRHCGDTDFMARACVRGVKFVCATRREVAAFRLWSGQLTKSWATVTAERNMLDERYRLREGVGLVARKWARWRFRLTNIAIYAERIRRFGWVSFDTVMERGGKW